MGIAICSIALLSAPKATAQRDVPSHALAKWSNEAGALDRPSTWNCTRIYPEYRAFLEAGNAPEEWKHVGWTFFDIETEASYTWLDWIDWANESGCGQIAFAKPEAFVVAPGALIGAAVAGSGAGLITASRGSGPKSPG